MDEKKKSKKSDNEVIDKKNKQSSNDNGKVSEKKSKKRDKSIGNSLTAEEITIYKSAASKEVFFHGNIYILNEKQSMQSYFLFYNVYN